MHSRRSQAPAHSAAAADARSVPLRFSDVSCVIPARLGASDATPATSIKLPARTAAPRLAPRKSPTTATARRSTAPAQNTQHHQRIAGVRRHPLTAQLAADARSVPPRSSDVSCVIRKRLGASDAAPASSIPLPARTAAPRIAPRKASPPATAPRATARNTQHHPMHSRRSQPPAHSASPADARSVLLRSSDISCVMLPRLGASDAAPAAPSQLSAHTAAPRLAPSQNPTTRYSPACNRQPTTHASTRSKRKPSRCTQRTTEVQRRQLRHP
jgi:hypothetical protein